MTATASKTPDDQSTFASIPPKSAAHTGRPLNICIASPEFIGPARDGGTGIAYTAMAQALATAGHHVTCLFLGAKDPSPEAWQRWVEKYERHGLTLVALPQINASELVAPSNLIKSYETYHWLKKNDRFDIIHFPDRQGPGYHTLTAKHHGLAFGRTTICVGLHSMAAWIKAADKQSVNEVAEVDTEFMERRAVALADAVVSPSHYLLNWVSDRNWEMPKHRYVQQNLLPTSPAPAEPPVASDLQEINELVFFDILETLKGIALFCDAVDAIPSAIAEKIHKVTFLGREGLIDGIRSRAYVEKRAQRWPFLLQITTGLDEIGAMNYLRQKNRMAVIPSLLENSPHKVLECLGANIAFVASRVGGIPELIAPADTGKVCFEPNAGALCAVLCAALTDGIRPARAVVDTRTNEQAWIDLHENSLATRNPPIQPPVQRPAPQIASEFQNLSNEAAQAAIQALSIDLTNPVALKALARIHLNAGLHEAALEACQLILKRNPKDAEALQMIEEALVQEAKLAENLSDSPKPFQSFVAGLTTPAFTYP